MNELAIAATVVACLGLLAVLAGRAQKNLLKMIERDRQIIDLYRGTIVVQETEIATLRARLAIAIEQEVARG